MKNVVIWVMGNVSDVGNILDVLLKLQQPTKQYNVKR